MRGGRGGERMGWMWDVEVDLMGGFVLVLERVVVVVDSVVVIVIVIDTPRRKRIL